MKKSKMGKTNLQGGGSNAYDPGLAARGMMMKQKEASGIGAYNNVIGKYEKNSGIARMMSNLGQTKASEEISEQEARARMMEQRRQAIERAKDIKSQRTQQAKEGQKSRTEYQGEVVEAVKDVIGQKATRAEKKKGLSSTKPPKLKEGKRRDPSKPKTGQKTTRAEKKRGLSSTKTDKPKTGGKRRDPSNPQGK